MPHSIQFVRTIGLTFSNHFFPLSLFFELNFNILQHLYCTTLVPVLYFKTFAIIFWNMSNLEWKLLLGSNFYQSEIIPLPFPLPPLGLSESIADLVFIQDKLKESNLWYFLPNKIQFRQTRFHVNKSNKYKFIIFSQNSAPLKKPKQ